MGMSVGPAEGDDQVMSAINTTPLVDVMLVLLIIFLITIPVAGEHHRRGGRKGLHLLERPPHRAGKPA